MVTDLAYWLALSLVPGVGSISYRRLLDRFETPEAVFRARRDELKAVEGLRAEAVRNILSFDALAAGKAELERVEKMGSEVVILHDERYPENLKNIYDPPPLLYMKGSLYESDRGAVAIVGSRDPSEYGKKATTRIGMDLARAGITIVSGMARGVDSAAHRATLKAGGRTIAVLGSGIDVIYPPENRNLYEEIIQKGAVLSPFPVGTKPERGNFPARNRVISGLSLGVVVIQATKPDSGALITARHALEQGREVFAVPGNVGMVVSRATNLLIKKGEAKLAETAADILEEILPHLIPREGTKEAPETPSPRLPKLEGQAQEVFSAIGDEADHIDTIAKKCKIPVQEVSGILLELELKGLILQLPGKMFVLAM